MNICEENHQPKYKITYKPAKGGTHTPEWLVCESCMGKSHFGSDDDIQSIQSVS